MYRKYEDDGVTGFFRRPVPVSVPDAVMAKLPYKTVWIEYHEIEPVAKVGAKPTKVKPNGWARFVGLSDPTRWNNVVIGIPGTRSHSPTTNRRES